MRKKKKKRYNPFDWLFPKERKYHLSILNIQGGRNIWSNQIL